MQHGFQCSALWRIAHCISTVGRKEGCLLFSHCFGPASSFRWFSSNRQVALHGRAVPVRVVCVASVCCMCEDCITFNLNCKQTRFVYGTYANCVYSTIISNKTYVLGNGVELSSLFTKISELTDGLV